MKYTQPISLDVFAQEQRCTINAKQGDTTARALKITLTELGKPIKPEEGTVAYFRALKADNKSVMHTATINDDGTISVDLTEQVFTKPGMVDADISLYKDGDIISALSFKIFVEQAPINNEWRSDNDFSDMVEATQEALDAAQKANQAAKDANDAEQATETAEGQRKTAEQSRVEAEQKRETQESTRQSNEQTRESQEQQRVEAENKRVEAENTRAENDAKWNAAEQVRADEETKRQAAEAERVKAETARADAEEKRDTAEKARAAAEDERATAEETRETNEGTRQTQEEARETAEGLRGTAEQARDAAEKERAAAEGQRAADTQDRLDAMDAATAKLEGLTVDAETVTSADEAAAVLSTEAEPEHYHIHFKVPKGDTGAAAGFGEVTATIADDEPGEPTVTVTQGEDNTAMTLAFEFQHLKGEPGKDGLGAGDMTSDVYDPTNKQQDIFKYVDDAIAKATPKITVTDDEQGNVTMTW